MITGSPIQLIKEVEDNPDLLNPLGVLLTLIPFASGEAELVSTVGTKHQSRERPLPLTD